MVQKRNVRRGMGPRANKGRSRARDQPETDLHLRDEGSDDEVIPLKKVRGTGPPQPPTMSPSTSAGEESSEEAGTETGDSSADEGESDKGGSSVPTPARAPNSDASPDSAHGKRRLVLRSKTLPEDALRFGVPGSKELYEDGLSASKRGGEPKRSIWEERQLVFEGLEALPDTIETLRFYRLEVFAEPAGEFCPEIVREFYANYGAELLKMKKPGQTNTALPMLDEITVRNVKVDISAEAINRVYFGADFRAPEEEKEYFDKLERRNHRSVIKWLATVIAHPEVGWVTQQSPKIVKGTLNQAARFWWHLMRYRLLVTQNDNTLTVAQAIGIAAIMSRYPVNMGRMIADEIRRRAPQPMTSLAFPCLITELCRRAQVVDMPDRAQCIKNVKFGDWRKGKKGDAPELFVIPTAANIEAPPESESTAMGDTIATEPAWPEAGDTAATAQAHATGPTSEAVEGAAGTTAATDLPPPPHPAPATSAGPTTSPAPPPVAQSAVDLFTFSRAGYRELAFKTLKAEKQIEVIMQQLKPQITKQINIAKRELREEYAQSREVFQSRLDGFETRLFALEQSKVEGSSAAFHAELKTLKAELETLKARERVEDFVLTPPTDVDIHIPVQNLLDSEDEGDDREKARGKRPLDAVVEDVHESNKRLRQLEEEMVKAAALNSLRDNYPDPTGASGSQLQEATQDIAASEAAQSGVEEHTA